MNLELLISTLTISGLMNETAGNESSSSTLECSEGFYTEEGVVCLPECGKWVAISHDAIIAVDVVVILSAVTYITVAVVVLILCCVHHERM